MRGFDWVDVVCGFLCIVFMVGIVGHEWKQARAFTNECKAVCYTKPYRVKEDHYSHRTCLCKVDGEWKTSGFMK